MVAHLAADPTDATLVKCRVIPFRPVLDGDGTALGDHGRPKPALDVGRFNLGCSRCRHSGSGSSALSLAPDRQREVWVGYHWRLRLPRLVMSVIGAVPEPPVQRCPLSDPNPCRRLA